MINKSVGAKLACAKAQLLNCICLYRVDDGNQGADTADRPLDPPGASSILHFSQSQNRYERNRRVFTVHGEVTPLIASMQLITHQLSLFGQNDGGI